MTKTTSYECVPSYFRAFMHYLVNFDIRICLSLYRIYLPSRRVVILLKKRPSCRSYVEDARGSSSSFPMHNPLEDRRVRSNKNTAMHIISATN